MARSLTAKQRRVLDVIRAFQVENGYSPSVRQIGEQLELSAASVQAHLVALDRKNYIRRTGEAHGITANYDPESDECLQVRAAQIIGAIAAGSPIEAITDHQGYVPLPETISPDDPRDYYALEVRGDSMIDDHILDGDRVLVRRQNTADDGDVRFEVPAHGGLRVRRRSRRHLRRRAGRAWSRSSGRRRRCSPSKTGR